MTSVQFEVTRRACEDLVDRIDDFVYDIINRQMAAATVDAKDIVDYRDVRIEVLTVALKHLARALEAASDDDAMRLLSWAATPANARRLVNVLCSLADGDDDVVAQRFLREAGIAAIGDGDD